MNILTCVGKKKKTLSFDSRRFERIKPEEPFLVEFQREIFEKMRLGQGKDISQGGVRFATSAYLRKGDTLDVTLYFPKNFPGIRKLKTRALVHRVHDPGDAHRFRVACQFMNVPQDNQQAISSYIQWASYPQN